MCIFFHPSWCQKGMVTTSTRERLGHGRGWILLSYDSRLGTKICHLFEKGVQKFLERRASLISASKGLMSISAKLVIIHVTSCVLWKTVQKEDGLCR